jgi:hypothetical protein
MTYSLLFKLNGEPWNKGMIIGITQIWSFSTE